MVVSVMQADSKPAAASSADVAVELVDVRVCDIRPVARETRLFELRPPTDGFLQPYKPGAHIDLYLPNGMVRQYSLVEPGSNPRSYILGIKRDTAGRGGSRYIHDELDLGAVLKVSAPRNNFPLVDDAEHVTFIAGGIGITPIWCMVQHLAAQARSWNLAYACRSRVDMAFLPELQKLGAGRFHPHFDEEAGNVLDIGAVVATAPRSAHLYCCGPEPMLKAFEAAAAGRPSTQVHVEYFTARQDAATEGGFWVELARSGAEYFVPPGKTILEILQDAGIAVSFSCELGICGACETKVIAGIPDHRDSVLNEEEQASNDRVMICCAGCKSERLVLDL
jgi:tetrachlorobenzoquinone reductase